MVTAFYSLSRVHGAELWLLFWLLCAALYFGISMLIKKNRTKYGIKNVSIGLLIAEIAVDLVWAMIYYPHGIYFNHGIVAVYGWLLWILILVIALTIVTVKNRKAE